VKGKQKGVHILRALWRLRSTKTEVFTRMFDAQVQSTLLYSAEIWGLGKHEKVERAHVFCCKRFLGLDSRTPNHMVYGDLGRYPLSINSCIRVVRYWLKLSKMKLDRLPKQAYVMLLNSAIPGHRNWAESVKQCLCSLGFGFVWLNGSVENENRFLSQFKQRLKDCYHQEWNWKNNSSERYRWYSTFKNGLGLENYLNTLEIKKFRDVFIRFRFGVNSLFTNQRYEVSQDLRARQCPFCAEKEDEEHFLLSCKGYEHLREKYLERHLNMRKKNCAYLMNSADARTTRAVAMYIFYSFKIREQKLYSMQI